MSAMADTTAATPAERSERLDWQHIADALDTRGNAAVEQLFTPAGCAELAALYDDSARFRSRIVMARYGFGRGEYQYFDYPLPEPIAKLRSILYRKLAPIANRWNEQMRIDVRYPDTHAEFIECCHAAGQLRIPANVTVHSADCDRFAHCAHAGVGFLR